MDIGVVITAAGMSSRMGRFKPLLKLGGTTIAERIVHSFQAVSVGTIAVVTGNHSGELERCLKAPDLVFLHNPAYESTEMFDSAKIGLAYLKDKCDRILFTPVDIPLFSVKTLQALIRSDAAVGIPVYRGKTGHPIILDKSIISGLLAFNGDGGMKAAIESLPVAKELIPVEDPYIDCDMDTPEEYQRLLNIYDSEFAQKAAAKFFESD
jgi:CTP:molybdopterin cytidylyltransferase MocA